LIKSALKKIAACIDVQTYQRASTHRMLRSLLPRFAAARRCGRREEVWDAAIARIGADTPVLYLEFGVFEGYSIRYFSERLHNPASRFFGFDSFEGLPEQWAGMNAGTFSTNGRMPQIADPRVSFVRGWFQDSLPGFLDDRSHDAPAGGTVFVHFDADLYSSTLFLLATLWSRFGGYDFCFDEFMGHELRAVHDAAGAFPSETEYLAYDLQGGFPTHVYGRMRKRSLRP
jgi:hypothetical protein